LAIDRKINQYFSTTVMTYDFLNPAVFGAGFFDQDFEQILQVMPDRTAQQQQARQYMQGIQKELNTTKRNELGLEQLKIFLDEMDRRRNLNWQQTFPWLVKELKHVV